jgi:hypothetical protein
MSRDELIAGDGVLGDVDDTPARLERAKQALVGLDLFGLQPRFEELCAELSRRYGVELGEPMRSNATDPMPAAAALGERIARDNALDMELYDFASSLCDERPL